jgi:tetratricopeptide (TPR) repeat protein
MEDETKAASYMRNNPQMLVDIGKMGFASEVDKAFGIMYSVEKKNDSAIYYFKAAKAKFKPNETPTTIIGWNTAYARHLERTGDYKGAAKILEENLQVALNAGSLTGQKMFREQLDSMYIKIGDKQMETVNKLALYTVKDSLDKQQKAKEVLNIEIDSENKRIEREAKQSEEKLRIKHNLQYMGITAGIVALFVLLATLGRFKVKPWLIRALGFFSFILLFEFIILLADKQIHHLTHGDPLQILLIKIVLIALLLPLHHWLEDKAIHYLLRHQHKQENVSATTH